MPFNLSNFYEVVHSFSTDFNLLLADSCQFVNNSAVDRVQKTAIMDGRAKHYGSDNVIKGRVCHTRNIIKRVDERTGTIIITNHTC